MSLLAPHRPLYRLTIGVLIATFGALAVGQYATARLWYGNTVSAAERREGLGSARHVKRVLDDEIAGLQRTARDNGVWDETYRYMTGRNPDYFRSAWGADMFSNLKADAVALVAPDGRLIALRGFDHRTGRFADPPARLGDAVRMGGALYRRFQGTAQASGLFELDRAIYGFGSSEVLPTSASGRVAGQLIVLRRLGHTLEEELSQVIDARVSLRIVTSEQSASLPKRAPLSMDGLRFDDRDDDLLQVSFVAADLGEHRAVRAIINSTRPVHAAALHAAHALLWSTLLTGLLIGALALIFLERRLLRPLQAVAERLVAIGRDGNPADRLTAHRHNDEIGTVVSSANLMLAELEETRRSAEAARDAALVASRVKSEFLARMSHEIRTPMNGVLGMTELLERTELTARQRKLSNTIHRSASSLLEILNGILDFSKIEASQIDMESREVELAAIVEETAELLSSRVQVHDLELVVDIDPSVPGMVDLDPLRLRQVLTNLIGNALKFTEQGEVVVAVRAAPVADGRTTLHVSVTDTGIGIAPEALERLFEPFAQADASTTRRFGGTGLGLTIARQLVELMGGTMDVTSRLGHGSVFSFSIPARVPAAEPPGSERPILDGLHVGLATGNASARAVICRHLEAVGAVVSTAADADGLRALVAPGGVANALLLIDHTLEPALVERDPGGAPVITMAPPADTGPGSKVGSSSSTVVGYLTKPVRRSLLIATIARITGRGAALDTASFDRAVGHAAMRERLGLRVLVVEDNAVNQAVAVGMLDALGCTVVLAGNGAEALDRMALGGIDVVLMDSQMPVMDGITATQILRQREGSGRGPRLPVIGISAHAIQGAREECLLAGMSDFVTKPFTLAELTRTLKRYATQPLPVPQLLAASGTNDRGSGPV
jgi:signal transduction histidine kinase/CheY-like chemotaxis protein